MVQKGSGTSNKAGRFKYLVLPGNESVLMKDALQRRSWWQSSGESSGWHFWWGANGQKFDFTSFGKGGPKIVNRLENHKEICTKSRLAVNLQKLQKSLPSGAAAWIPCTFVLQAKSPDRATSNALAQAQQKLEAEGKGKVWIVKPAALNRGNGICVYNSLPEVLEHMHGARAGSTWVVQKYIENPLLVNGRKFDIRAYVLVTPDSRVYLYRDAYVRTSGTPFSMRDLGDRSAHLTNDAVQKGLETYNMHEDHCKLTLAQLQEAVGPAISVENGVLPQMRLAVSRLFGAVTPRLNPRRLQHCFELLGLDFMIDDTGQVYLIEVNTSPALFRAGAVLAEMLPKVVEEVVQKAVDPWFPPPPGVELPEQLNGFQLVDLEAPGAGFR